MGSRQAMAPSVNRSTFIKCTIYLTVLLTLVTILFGNLHLVKWFTPLGHTNSWIDSVTISNGTKYVLPCKISSPEAIDSIAHVVSDECKIKLANAACKNVQGKLTPRSIVNHCPRGDYVPYRYVGCFPFKNIYFNSSMEYLLENSPKKCVDYCTIRNYRYAFIQNERLCYCDDEKPNPELRHNDRVCNIPCPGNPTQYCGGLVDISVYETGLAKHPELPIKLYPRAQDKPVRVAFLLMFHKRNLRQIRRFFRAIYDKHHYYYIHIDPKQHYLYRELLKLEKLFPNVYVARERHTIVWGCFTQLQAMLASLKHILTMPSWEADYILNLSESDFPVKTIARLTEFLTANRGRNFLFLQNVVTIDHFLSQTGYNKNFVECENRMRLIGDRQLPTGITANGASDWFCLTREFVQYVLDERHDLVADFMTIMEHTIFATENLFAQVLLNSHFCQTHYNDGLRLVSWASGKGCAKDRSIQWTGCSPVTIRRQNWPDLQQAMSETMYAARKFNPVFDQTVILMVEENAFGKYPSNVPNLNAYWQNVYHYEDEKHEGRMGAVLNVAHVLLYLNALTNGYADYEVLKILEVTHYFHRDAFQGFLIRHTALVNDQRLELEVLAKPRNTLSLNRTLEGRLSNVKVEVSNVIDVVEQLPIDFDRVLSVDKRPALVFHLPPTKGRPAKQTINHTVTVDWINPAMRSEMVEPYTIVEKDEGMEHHGLRNTALKTPLAEGIWSAKVALNGSYVGMVEFLVTSNAPIELPPSTTPTDTCTRPRGLFETKFAESLSCTIQTSARVLQKYARFSANVHKTFLVENTCLAGGEIATEHLSSKSPLVRCTDVLWSTLSPDPKSDIYYRLKKRN